MDGSGQISGQAVAAGNGVASGSVAMGVNSAPVAPPQPKAALTLNDLAALKGHRELAMSPNLLAFNMYAAEMRVALKEPTALEASEQGMGIEKVIGTRWKAMGPEEKSAHIEKAKLEQDKLRAEGGVPQFPMPSRPKRNKHSEQELGPDGLPVPRKKRGRPPKLDRTVGQNPGAGAAVYVAPPGHAVGNLEGMDPSAAMHVRSQLAVTADGPASAVPPGGDDLLGKRVEGVVDGCFDTGYFLTVRVNGSVLRGVIFREDTCMRAVGLHAAQQRAAQRKAAKQAAQHHAAQAAQINAQLANPNAVPVMNTDVSPPS